MNNSKSIILLDERGENWNWYLYTIVNDNGVIRARGTFQIRDKDEIHKRNINRKYKNMHRKQFKLLSGLVGDWTWRIRIQIAENGKIYSPGFELENRDEEKKISKEYKRKNIYKVREKDRIRSKGKQAIRIKKYRRGYMRIYQNKNIRNLGFEPLNEIIDGITNEAHHVNKEEVIYVPQVIHRKIRHNLKTGKNMDLINSIAYGFD